VGDADVDLAGAADREAVLLDLDLPALLFLGIVEEEGGHEERPSLPPAKESPPASFRP
jgi:hypothetical protein